MSRCDTCNKGCDSTCQQPSLWEQGMAINSDAIRNAARALIALIEELQGVTRWPSTVDEHANQAVEAIIEATINELIIEWRKAKS